MTFVIIVPFALIILFIIFVIDNFEVNFNPFLTFYPFYFHHFSYLDTSKIGIFIISDYKYNS